MTALSNALYAILFASGVTVVPTKTAMESCITTVSHGLIEVGGHSHVRRAANHSCLGEELAVQVMMMASIWSNTSI